VPGVRVRMAKAAAPAATVPLQTAAPMWGLVPPARGVRVEVALVWVLVAALREGDQAYPSAAVAFGCWTLCSKRSDGCAGTFPLPVHPL